MTRSMVLVGAIALGVIACGPGPQGSLTHDTEPAFDAWVELDGAGRIAARGLRISDDPGQATRSAAASSPAQEEPAAHGPAIQPALVDFLATAAGEAQVEVVISVRTTHRLSKLPVFDATFARDDPVNLDISAQREFVQQSDDALRAPEREPVKADIRAQGGQVLEEFRLGNAVATRLSADALRRMLAGRDDIVAASLLWGDQPPASYQVDDARSRMGSDPWVGSGYDGTGYRVGLVDTGVYASHYTLSQPDPIETYKDCANTPYSNCSYYPYPYYYNAADTSSGGGHGTAMANILVGNDNLGGAYEGVAPGARVDSANAYYGPTHTTYYLTGVLRAFDLLDDLDDVIVINAISDDTPTSTVSLAANDLYDEGVVVVAPVGNIQGADTLAPANAHKVLGAGAYYTSTGGDYPYQCGGVSDSSGRFKPDITAPTYFLAAANSSSTAVASYSGTCPAAAMTGGAAVLLRDYYDAQGWSTDPGAIYTGLIAFGDEGGADLNDTDGAGNLTLGELSSASWRSGLTYLDPGESYDVWFYVSPGACDLRSGIWWAEEPPLGHSAIDLSLIQGSTLKAWSTHFNSVFQKVVYPAGMGVGWWRINLKSYSGNGVDNVKVHYLIHYRTNC